MTGRRKGTPCACETDPCSCGSSKGKCIRTINNLSPDPNGDFFIEAGSGITITQTGDNSFEVSFDGTLPSNPLIYKGTVGSGGTVAVLPAADPDNIGWMYIAIEAATSPVTYEVGDTLISDGYTWQVIPSGDDPVDWSQILNTPTTLAGYGITDAMQADTTPGVWAYTHSGVYQGQTAIAGNAAANSLLARDSDGCGQVADPAADTDSDYAVNVRTLNRRLTDGSVSKIGTINVGSDLKPVKLVAGVPTAVTDDLVSTTGAQTVAGVKTFTNGLVSSMSAFATIDIKSARISGNVGGLRYYDGNGTLLSQIASNTDGHIYIDLNGTNKSVQLTSTRGYNAAYTADLATIGTIDAYTPMVRTTGNQTIGGIKTFTSNPVILGDWPNLQIKTSAVLDGTAHEDKGNIVWKDNNDNVIAQLRFNMRANNTTQIQLVVKNSDNTDKYVTLAAGDVI